MIITNKQQIKCLFDHHVWKYESWTVSSGNDLTGGVAFTKYCIHCPETGVDRFSRADLTYNLKNLPIELQKVVRSLIMGGVSIDISKLFKSKSVR